MLLSTFYSQKSGKARGCTAVKGKRRPDLRPRPNLRASLQMKSGFPEQEHVGGAWGTQADVPLGNGTGSWGQMVRSPYLHLSQVSPTLLHMGSPWQGRAVLWVPREAMTKFPPHPRFLGPLLCPEKLCGTESSARFGFQSSSCVWAGQITG